MRLVRLILVFSSILAARTPEWDRAHELYQRTEYQQSLDVLVPLHQKDAAALQLIGQSYFMLGEYKKATEALEKAVALEPEYCRSAALAGAHVRAARGDGEPIHGARLCHQLATDV